MTLDSARYGSSATGKTHRVVARSAAVLVPPVVPRVGVDRAPPTRKSAVRPPTARQTFGPEAAAGEPEAGSTYAESVELAREHWLRFWTALAANPRVQPGSPVESG